MTQQPLKHLKIPKKIGQGEGGATIPHLYEYFQQIDDYIDQLLNQSGSGDMQKSVYDTNDNGIVDEAESVEWNNVQNKPSFYPPAEHNHDGVYAPVTHSHATNVTPIDNPSEATAEDIANKLNELIVSLQG